MADGAAVGAGKTGVLFFFNAGDHQPGGNFHLAQDVPLFVFGLAGHQFVEFVRMHLSQSSPFRGADSPPYLPESSYIERANIRLGTLSKSRVESMLELLGGNSDVA